jgi:hypothetical protein
MYISSSSASSSRPPSWGNISGSGTKKWDGTECGTSELGSEIKHGTGHRKDRGKSRDSVGESSSREKDRDGKDNSADNDEDGRDVEANSNDTEDSRGDLEDSRGEHENGRGVSVPKSP